MTPQRNIVELPRDLEGQHPCWSATRFFFNNLGYIYTLVSTLAKFDTNYTIIFRNNDEDFSKIISSKSKKKIVKENSRIFRNIPFVEMNVPKLIN